MPLPIHRKPLNISVCHASSFENIRYLLTATRDHLLPVFYDPIKVSMSLFFHRDNFGVIDSHSAYVALSFDLGIPD